MKYIFTLIALVLTGMIHSQTTHESIQEVYELLEESLKCNLAEKERKTYTSHKFKINDEELRVYGYQIFIGLEIPRSSKKHYKSINFEEFSSNIESQLLKSSYHLKFKNEEEGLLTFSKFKNEQKSFLEIYLPTDTDYFVELIHVDQIPKYDLTKCLQLHEFEKEMYTNSCYAQVALQDSCETTQKIFYIYSGGNFKEKYVKKINLELSPQTNLWEKRKMENCYAADQNQCLVWCPEKSNAYSIEIYIVTDTTIVKEFKKQSFNIKRVIKEGGTKEWRKVLCKEEINNEIILSIQNILIADGIESKFKNDWLDNQFKNAIIKFQKKYQLPLGQLDFTTLNKLSKVSSL